MLLIRFKDVTFELAFVYNFIVVFYNFMGKTLLSFLYENKEVSVNYSDDAFQEHLGRNKNK